MIYFFDIAADSAIKYNTWHKWAMFYASSKLFALSYEGNKEDLDFTVKLAV